MKAELEDILFATERPGVSDLIYFLASSDFYTAPCSTKFHLAKPGGLAEHTVNVLLRAKEINARYNAPHKMDSIVLASVGHDLCKVNFYSTDLEPPTDSQVTYLRGLCSKAGIMPPEKTNKSHASACIDHLKSMKKPPLPPFTPGYTVKDLLPLGHGEKSLYVMQQFVKLTVDEALSIRWHMSAFDLNPNSEYQRHAFNNALELSSLVAIIALADMEASWLVEVSHDKKEV